MREITLAGFEMGVESGIGRVLLLIEDGADSEEVSWVNRFAGINELRVSWVGG